MAYVIKNIVLSSGKVVDLPVFPDVYIGELPQAAKKYYRYGGVAYQCMLDNFSSIYTEDELLELFNGLLGTSKTQLNRNIPSSAGTYVGVLLWTYSHSEDKYYLRLEVTTSTNAIVLGYKQLGINSSFFINGRSTYSGASHEFDDVVAGWNQSSSHNAANYDTFEDKWTIATNYGNPPFSTYNYSFDRVSSNIAAYKEAHPNSTLTAGVFDPQNNTDPYIIDPATWGGGNGDREIDPDEIEKAEIPDLPTLSATDTGLITVYTATGAQLGALANYLWANWWDIDTNFKKLFSDPMNCLIGLSIVPVAPTAGGAENVKFGNITTNIALNKVTSQYVELDCGSINIKEWIGSFLDYSPFVNISLYLPYCGYHELSPDDVMNDTIHVVYHVDVLSGGCCAMVETAKKGLLYMYNGSCIANVPITAINYSGAIQNAVSAVGAGLSMAAGIATGAAPLTAMGAASMLSSAANTAINSKPTIQRSGAMGGAAGLMSYQKPLLVITRPRMSVPDKLNKFTGLTTNVTMNLSQVKGFTQVELIHLTSVPATQAEKEELTRILREGAIF